MIINNIAKHICFRLVDSSDAEFILSLRLDPEKNQYLSATKDDIGAQRTWIQEYKEREKNKQEYYFIIESNDSEKLGTIRLYDFLTDSFCWGSWLMKHDAPPYAAVESVLSIYEIGLYWLGFHQSHTDVRKGNHAVINFLLNFGAVITNEDEINYYFRMTIDTYEKTKKKYKRFLAS
jgi:RimJ/RimL family protein N-acetyltransferase